MLETIEYFVIASFAGTLGTMLGLGGGVFLVPILTLSFGVPLRVAIAASAISVVANSVSGSRRYLELRYTNLRLAQVLLVTTTLGALIGGLVAVSLPAGVLKGAFATLLAVIAVLMIRRQLAIGASAVELEPPPDPYRLGGLYIDGPAGEVVRYVPHRIRSGLSLSTLAGVASGMFGIGGGPLSVPVMNMVMGVPLKAAASTSAFMVGLTASVSALVYLSAGFVNPAIVIPAVFGIIVGAHFGVGLALRLHPRILVVIFVAVMSILSVFMYLDAIGALS